MFMPITITFHIFRYTITLTVKSRTRHSAKWRVLYYRNTWNWLNRLPVLPFLYAIIIKQGWIVKHGWGDKIRRNIMFLLARSRKAPPCCRLCSMKKVKRKTAYYNAFCFTTRKGLKSPPFPGVKQDSRVFLPKYGSSKKKREVKIIWKEYARGECWLYCAGSAAYHAIRCQSALQGEEYI